MCAGNSGFPATWTSGDTLRIQPLRLLLAPPTGLAGAQAPAEPLFELGYEPGAAEGPPGSLVPAQGVQLRIARRHRQEGRPVADRIQQRRHGD